MNTGQALLLHIDLIVADMARSLQFYVDKLGFEVLEDGTVQGDLPLFISDAQCSTMRLCLISSSRVGAAIELVELRGASSSALPPSRMNPSFVTEDLDALCQRLSQHGVFPHGPHFTVRLPRIGASRIVFFQDPDGHRLEFTERIPAGHNNLAKL